ncbi:MAG: HAD hydrolase-like protein, partial [Robiginitomaculum sp.]|nr:HAD hydrolase-like protein [Robiginitomaculum sp.]
SRNWLAELAGYDIERSRVLAIGDNIQTDLLGAQEQNYDALFVADGLDAGNADAVANLLEKHDIYVKYMVSSLNW